MNMEEDKLLVKIAEMYYQEDKNQSQISKALNIHRTTISRLLKRTREEGIVNISINYDYAGTYRLENQLEEMFGLEKAIIVPVATDMKLEQKNKMLADAVNTYLKTKIKDNMILGFSWGKTIAAVGESLAIEGYKDITCVPMIGGPAGRLCSDYHVNTITYQAAKNLEAKALLIDAPAIPETIALKDALLKNDFNQALSQMWKQLDIAILGIGSPCLSMNETWSQFYGDDVTALLEREQAVGDVVSRFYTMDGVEIKNDLNDRIVGISTYDLKQTKIRIGVVEAVEKAKAIVGAMHGRYINVLVTTEETAREVLAISKRQS